MIDERQRWQRRALSRAQRHGSGQSGQRHRTYEWTEGELATGDTVIAIAPSSARYHVVAYDFGVKRNILRMLADRGCRMTVVPAQTPAAEVLALKPDGIFLSNGPGDPEPCDYAIAAIRALLETEIPVFGICLGHQLLGLASGAKTLKMKFGHHGANHPVQDLETGRVMITSQNHGFAVDEASLPANAARHPPLPVRRSAAGHCAAPTSRRSASRAIRRPARARTMWAAVRSFHRDDGDQPTKSTLRQPAT